MAEAEGQDTVSITSKWGGFSLGGKNALDIFLFIMMLALGAMAMWQHLLRSAEHDSLDCRLKLTLFMQTVPPDKPIDWRRVPTDVFGCVPKFLYDRDITK